MEQKIKEWLLTQGYVLELGVAAEFQRAEFHTTLANFYIDPVSGNARQIDVIAGRNDYTGFFQAEFVVECKKSTDKPWVLLAAEDSGDGFSKLYDFALTSSGARTALIEGDIAFLNLPWMNYNGSRGVGLVQAFARNDSDIAFKAVSGAMAAAIARRRELCKHLGDNTRMVFVFPVVVIGSRLFEGKLNSSGELDVAEIKEAKLYFPMQFGEEVGTFVFVTTEENVRSFVRDAAIAVDALAQFLAPVAEQKLDALRPK